MASKRNSLYVYPATGLLSATVCWAGSLFLPEIPALQQYYPAVVLGIFLYLCGKYVTHMKTGNDIVTLIVLILGSILGWRAAVEIGHPLGEPVPFVAAGALGGLITAIGWLIAWKLRSIAIRLLIILTFAGTLGGGIFQFVDHYLDATGDVWVLILFTVWQTLFFAGIGIAHRR